MGRKKGSKNKPKEQKTETVCNEAEVKPLEQPKQELPAVPSGVG